MLGVPVLSNDLAGAICGALGLNPAGLRSVTLRLRAGEVASVLVLRYVTKEEGDKMALELKRYTLVEAKAVEP